VSYKKKYDFFALLKSMKKGGGSGVGSGYVSQRGSASKCNGSPILPYAILDLYGIHLYKQRSDGNRKHATGF
jgi:hypothetical protein